ncbi:protein PET117 homolog, mitochondrial [Sitodiplosis mosellana]|uniref:protein PET117 homolog, mitochondrial n=1 Tax=Sitodiplosis mosellana TaxID=263140 RepID=UPI002443C86A|nr:protein PET117 homolog, mitochondrial [Sitodiplosis mosellana]
MSTAAKLTFVASLATTAGIISFIYYKQHDDRIKLHAGIIRDVQRQEQRKFENLYVLEQQQELTKKLKEREQKDLETQNLQTN